MARDVGEIYLDVNADASSLKRQIRRAAQQAGKDFGKTFNSEAEKSMAPGLSRLGKQISDTMEDNGRKSAIEFGEGFRRRVRGINLGFDDMIEQAAADQNWGPLLRQFGNVEEGAERVRNRLLEWRQEVGRLGGGQFDEITANLNGYIAEVDKGERQIAEMNAAQERNNALNRDAAENTKRQANNQRFLNEALKESAASLKAQNDEMAKNRLVISEKATKRLRFATDDLNESMRGSVRELDAIARRKTSTDEQVDSASALSKEYQGLQRRLKEVTREHDLMTTGMRQGSSEYNKALRTTNTELVALKARLKALTARKTTLEIDIDTPAPAALQARGFAAAKAYWRGVRKASKSAGDGGLGDVFKNLSRRWNETLLAFSASITVLLRYFAVLGGPIASLGSALASIATSVIGALGVGLAGAAAAFAGVGAAAVGAFLLAKKAMESFEDSFPATYKAIEGLKDSFNKVQVDKFAKEWAKSVEGFADAAADSFGEIGTSLGKAAAKITDAFTGIVKSSAWKGFIGAVEGDLSDALTGIGVGFAGFSGVMLQWMTAAAPLAKNLGERFGEWGQRINDSLATDNGQQALKDFFADAQRSIDAIISIIGDLGSAFGTVFSAGVDDGNTMLETLAGLAGKFNDWTKSVEGQTALKEWFAEGRETFDRLLPMIGKVSASISDLVTPESMDRLRDFIDNLGELIPKVLDVVAAVDRADGLNVMAAAIIGLADSINPLLPLIGKLADIIADLPPETIQAIATAFAILWAGFKVAGLVTAINGIATSLGAMYTALKLLGAQGIYAAIVAGFRVISAGIMSIPVFGWIIAAITLVVAALVWFFTQTETGKKAWQNIKDAAEDVAKWFTDTLVPWLQGVWDSIKAGFTAVTDWFGNAWQTIKDAPQAALDWYNDVFIAGIESVWQTIKDGITAVGDWFGDVWQSILDAPQAVMDWFTGTLVPFFQELPGKILEAFLAMVTFFFSLPGRIIGALASLAALLITWITDAWNAAYDWVVTNVPLILTWFAELPGKIWDALKSAGTAILDWITDAWNAAYDWVVETAPKLIDWFKELPGKIIAGLDALGALLLGWITTAWNTMYDAVAGFFEDFVTFWSELPQRIMDGLAAFGETLATFFTGVWEGIKTAAGVALDALVFLFVDLPNRIITGLLAFGQMLWDAMKAGLDEGGLAAAEGIEELVASFGELPDKIIAAVSTLIELAKAWMGDVWAGITEAATTAWNNEVAFWTGLPGKIIGFITPLISQATTWMGNVWSGISNAISTGWAAVLSFFTSLPGKVMGAISGLIGQMTTFGSSVINGFKSGLESAWGAVSSWVGGIGSKITGLVGDGFSILKNAGRNIIDGFLAGLKESWKKVTDFVGGIGSWIANNKGPKQYDLRLLQPAGGWIMEGLQRGIKDAMPDLKRTLGAVSNAVNVNGSSSYGLNTAGRGGGNPPPAGGRLAGATVASGAIQIVTPVKDPAIVASMVLDGLVARAQ